MRREPWMRRPTRVPQPMPVLRPTQGPPGTPEPGWTPPPTRAPQRMPGPAWPSSRRLPRRVQPSTRRRSTNGSPAQYRSTSRLLVIRSVDAGHDVQSLLLIRSPIPDGAATDTPRSRYPARRWPPPPFRALPRLPCQGGPPRALTGGLWRPPQAGVRGFVTDARRSRPQVAPAGRVRARGSRSPPRVAFAPAGRVRRRDPSPAEHRRSGRPRAGHRSIS